MQFAQFVCTGIVLIFLEPSIPKMLQVGSLHPPGHDTGHFFQ